MKIIDNAFMDELSAAAAAAPRLRTHFNLHQTLEDPIHRVIMAAVPGTYVRPHRHLASGKFEDFSILRGRAVVLSFSDSGVIRRRAELAAGDGVPMVELAPDEWHTFFPLDDKVVVCEVKPGPYSKPVASDYAAWSPEEGTPGAEQLIKWFRIAAEGEAWERKGSLH